jgi:hypothetical protein
VASNGSEAGRRAVRVLEIRTGPDGPGGGLPARIGPVLRHRLRLGPCLVENRAVVARSSVARVGSGWGEGRSDAATRVGVRRMLPSASSGRRRGQGRGEGGGARRVGVLAARATELRTGSGRSSVTHVWSSPPTGLGDGLAAGFESFLRRRAGHRSGTTENRSQSVRSSVDYGPKGRVDGGCGPNQPQQAHRAGPGCSWPCGAPKAVLETAFSARDGEARARRAPRTPTGRAPSSWPRPLGGSRREEDRRTGRDVPRREERIASQPWPQRDGVSTWPFGAQKAVLETGCSAHDGELRTETSR